MNSAQLTYQMLENQTLWQTAAHCHAALDAVEIPHAIVGGVAVCLHGYRRNMVDLDLRRRTEVKLASGLGSPRRTHRDLADVVEPVAVHHLDRSFARHLHKSLRPAFRKLVEQSRQ